MTPIELKVLRKQYGLTQADFGARLTPPVSRLTIYNWESGKFSIPADLERRLMAADLLKSVEPKETPKQKAERERDEREWIARDVSAYRSLRAWPEYSSHVKAMALFNSQGKTWHPKALPLIYAEFPDILQDPTGEYPMTKEQSHATLGITKGD